METAAKREIPGMHDERLDPGFYAEFYCEECEDVETFGPYPTAERAHEAYDRILRSHSPEDFDVYEIPEEGS